MSSKTKASHIERIERPDRDVFYQNYVLPNKPVIITGAISDWKAISSWSLNYFKSVVGDTDIRVEVSPNRVFPPVHEESMKRFGYHMESMTFSQYIDRISSRDPAQEICYLAQQPVDVLFPPLMNDIKRPDYFKEKSHISTNFWFAGAGSTTPMHYDLVHNLFAQVIGRKRFILYGPDQTRLLYPFPNSSPISHFSRVDVDNPDLEKFPDFRRANPLECVVEAGDLLFLPIFWWHHVYSLELSVSISFWSHPGWTKNLNPAALRLHYTSLLEVLRRLKKKVKRGNKPQPAG